MPQGIFINDNNQPVSQTFLPLTSSLRGVSSVTSVVTTRDVLEGHDTSGRSTTDSPEDSSDPGMRFPNFFFSLVVANAPSLPLHYSFLDSSSSASAPLHL